MIERDRAPWGENLFAAFATAVCAIIFTTTAHAQDGGIDRGIDGGFDGGEPVSTATAMAGHVMVEVAPTAVRVTEVYVLIVEARIEVPEGGAWLQLPAEAQSVQVDRGDELLRPAHGGLALLRPLEPGRQAVAFSYVIPAEEGRTTIVHRIPFSVGTLHVMWPAGAPVSAQAMGFADRGTIQMGPRPMRVLERADFGAGERLVIVTSSQPAPPPEQAAEVTAQDPLGPIRSFTLIVALLLLLAGFVLPATGRWPRASS